MPNVISISIPEEQLDMLKQFSDVLMTPHDKRSPIIESTFTSRALVDSESYSEEYWIAAIKIQLWFKKQRTGKKQVSDTSSDVLDTSELFSDILKFARRVLNDNKFPIKRNGRYLLEGHLYTLSFGDRPVDTFCDHEDDQAAISFNCETIIFYLRKDENVDGGNFEYIDNNGVRQTIPVYDGQMIMMGGNVMHRPQPCYGEGHRISIVIQLESLR